jgi:Na+-driven multidrug efflux pump
MKSRRLLLAIAIGACLATITWFVPDPFLHVLNTPARLMAGWLGSATASAGGKKSF